MIVGGTFDERTDQTSSTAGNINSSGFFRVFTGFTDGPRDATGSR